MALCLVQRNNKASFSRLRYSGMVRVRVVGLGLAARPIHVHPDICIYVARGQRNWLDAQL